MYMCVWCVWVCRRLGVRGGVAYSMPVIAFNGSTRTHTHVPFLYLPRLICPSTVYLSVSVFCVCTQHSPFSNILSFSRERVLQLLFFDVDCRRCCVYALSLHTYVAMTKHPHSTHTQHTHTQRCAHKWIN